MWYLTDRSLFRSALASGPFPSAVSKGRQAGFSLPGSHSWRSQDLNSELPSSNTIAPASYDPWPLLGQGPTALMVEDSREVRPQSSQVTAESLQCPRSLRLSYTGDCWTGGTWGLDRLFTETSCDI